MNNPLLSDPRVQQARKLIREALDDHSCRIDGVSPPDPSLADTYGEMLNQLTQIRGGPPIWPYLSSGLGNGPWVRLADGSVKLDFISGIGVHGAGHSHPNLIDAAIEGALEDTVMQGNLQQHPATIHLCERLVGMARCDKAPLEHCLLTTSGAMANENAMKLAFHAAAPADRVLAFDNAFAGRSIALAALTDRPKYRDGLPIALAVDYLPFRDAHHPKRSTRWAVDELKRLLNRHPDRYAMFWAEPIAGEGGYYAGGLDFFSALCEELRAAKVPIVFDEVQSFGRTSRPFAFQHYGLEEFADIVTVGKISQTCATLYRPNFHPQSPILSQTFTGSSTS
ncbi:MAG: aminotransferase class III-fold pyridoxal phosphate-dependent enzyme, partial [Planctomycetota bacterium]